MKCKTKALIIRAILETLEHRRLLSFAAPVSYQVGTNPQNVATADFNGDGRSDVVTANAGSNSLSVLLSNADGTLQSAQTIPIAGASPVAIAVGDVDGDLKRDIVMAGGDTVKVLLGNGNGTFQPALDIVLPSQFPPGYTGTTPLTQFPSSVVVGDLNNDGKLDLAAGAQTFFTTSYIGYYGGTYYQTYFQGYVDVLIGNGNGTFGTANTYLQGYSAPSVSLADFNGDNRLDVMTGPNSVAVALGNGNGTLQPPLYSNNYGTSVIGDFDNDNNLDFVVSYGSAMYFAKGQGNGTFQSLQSGPAVPVRSFVVGDVNSDGKLDLVVSASETHFTSYGYYGGYDPVTTDSTKVLLGYGDGTFSLPITTTLSTYAGDPWSNSTALGDFNGDGHPDMVATDRGTSSVFVQLNQNDFILPGKLRINDATAVTEGNSGTVDAVFTVTRAGGVGLNISVNYGTADGTASAASGDYAPTSGTLNFAPGETSKTIIVPVKGDRRGEYDETFFLNLTGAVNGDILDSQGVGTIIDDEPRLSISGGAAVTEGDSGMKPMQFTATLSAPSDVTVTVDYGTSDSSARAGKDFVAVTGTVTFLPGETSRTFSVPIIGDLIPENDETFYATLTGSNGALVLAGYGFSETDGLIHDNDPDTSIVISNVSRAEGNTVGQQTPFQFTLTLQKPTEKEVYVQWATAIGTATSSGKNMDYQAGSGYVYFYPGQMTASVYVYVNGDTRNESDETFFVNLSQPSGATIADSQGVGTILNDDGGRGKKWIGPAIGGNWSTAANWSPSGAPVSTSLVTISSASVTLSASATVSELLLNSSAILTLSSSGNGVLRTPGLYIDYGATLNLSDNDLIVDYTAGSSPLGTWNNGYFDGVTGLIVSGSNAGAWNGVGIVTTRPDALNGVTTLGVGDASQVLGLSGTQTGLFSGQTVDATTVLIKYTYGGDANLDRTVDIRDLQVLSNNLNGSAKVFGQGDFNYDGIANNVDLGILALNWQKTLATPAPTLPGSISPVPRRTATRVITLIQ